MDFDRDRFAEVLGSSFVLKTTEGQSVDLRLVEVSGIRERPHQFSFSIVFSVAQGYTVEQGLYDLEHESLGTVQLFLVPVDETPEGMKLEAVFNFVREDESETQ